MQIPYKGNIEPRSVLSKVKGATVFPDVEFEFTMLREEAGWQIVLHVYIDDTQVLEKEFDVLAEGLGLRLSKYISGLDFIFSPDIDSLDSLRDTLSRHFLSFELHTLTATWRNLANSDERVSLDARFVFGRFSLTLSKEEAAKIFTRVVFKEDY